MACFQVSQLGGSRNETWRGQGVRSLLSWNLPKLSQLRRCNGGFGPGTTQNHLRTKQFVGGTRNSSGMAAYALRNEQVGRCHGEYYPNKLGEILCPLIRPFCCVFLGFSAAEFGNPGGIYELPVFLDTCVLCVQHFV
jgi:hypothetical protein